MVESILCFMKRLFDIIMALLGLIIFSIPFLICALAVRLSSKGPIFNISDRIGVNNSHFNMIKFRSMLVETPQLATHLMKQSSQSFLTPVGGFLRKTSLDELPQLINVLKGEMSIVGPRPSLYNQDDQINLRTESGCHALVPGITGWAQINGRDKISIKQKVELDTWYMNHYSLWLDCKIILMTIWSVLFGSKDVSH